jgi:2'-5' RNA ligase superfamily
MTIQLSAETARLAATPHRLGPNPLWWHKGMKLPNYIEQLAKGLSRGLGVPEDSSRAIATAIYNVSKWKDGIPTGNMPRVRPETQAASAAAWAEFQALRAKAHASHATEHALELVTKHASGGGRPTVLRPSTSAVAKVAPSKVGAASEVAATKSSGKATPAAAKPVKAAAVKSASPPSGVKQQIADLKAQAAEDTAEAILLDQEANGIVQNHLSGSAASAVGGVQTVAGSTSTTVPPTSSAAGSSSSSTSSATSSSTTATTKTTQQYEAEVVSLRQQAQALRNKAKALLAQAAALEKQAASAGAAALNRAAVQASDEVGGTELAEDTPKSLTPRSGMVACTVGSGKYRGKHITLAYLGPNVDDHTHRLALRHAMQLAMRYGPVKARAGGITVFPKSGEDGHPIVVPVDSPALDDMHHHLKEMGLHRSEHGFKAHMTVRYHDGHGKVPVPQPEDPQDVILRDISVHVGKHVHRFPFTGYINADTETQPDEARARGIEHALQFAQPNRSDPRYHDGEQPTTTPPTPIRGRRNMDTGSPTAEKRRRALQHGHALPPLHGGEGGAARFPIENESDLKKAFRMVGLAKGDKGAIRRYIMRRARALGLGHLIPAHWTSGMTEAAIDAMDYAASLELYENIVDQGGTKVHYHGKGKKPPAKKGHHARGHHSGASSGRHTGDEDGSEADDDSDGRHKITDEESLRKAIRNHHRTSDPKRVRKHIMRKAKAMGKSHMIPSHWQEDGSMSTESSGRGPKTGTWNGMEW